MGQYVCTVSAWSVSSQGDVLKAAEYRSSPLTVRWDAKRTEAFISSDQIENMFKHRAEEEP